MTKNWFWKEKLVRSLIQTWANGTQVTLIIFVKISFNNQTFLQLCEIIEIFLLIQIEFLKHLNIQF